MSFKRVTAGRGDGLLCVSLLWHFIIFTLIAFVGWFFPFLILFPHVRASEVRDKKYRL